MLSCLFLSALPEGEGVCLIYPAIPRQDHARSLLLMLILSRVCVYVCVYECVYLRFVCNSSCRKRDDGNGLDLFMEKGF